MYYKYLICIYNIINFYIIILNIIQILIHIVPLFNRATTHKYDRKRNAINILPVHYTKFLIFKRTCMNMKYSENVS